jgi:hypothetical protein
MIKKIYLLLFSVFLLLNVSPVVGQTFQDEMDESNRQFEVWAVSLSDFVKDVQFNEEDVQSLITLWKDFTALGGEEGAEDKEYVDFKTILQDEAYRTWAKSKGINGEIWLKKTMRILAVMMRKTIDEANNAEEQFDMKAQLEELENLRAEMGEEAYQEMKKGIEASAAAMEGLDNAYKHLPVPTDAEKTLLTKYEAQLQEIE